MQDIIAKAKQYRKTVAFIVGLLVAAGALSSGVADKWLGIADEGLTIIEQDINNTSE